MVSTTQDDGLILSITFVPEPDTSGCPHDNNPCDRIFRCTLHGNVVSRLDVGLHQPPAPSKDLALVFFRKGKYLYGALGRAPGHPPGQKPGWFGTSRMCTLPLHCNDLTSLRIYNYYYDYYYYCFAIVTHGFYLKKSNCLWIFSFNIQQWIINIKWNILANKTQTNL